MPTFRLRWRGYDRTEVDDFLRQTASEKAKAQAQTDPKEDSDRLQATRRELERLTKLRHDVASGLLAVSEAARRDAETLLSAKAEASAGTTETTPTVDELVASSSGGEPAGARRSSRLLYGSFAFGLLCGFALAVLIRPSGTAPPATEAAEVDQQVPEVAAVSGQPELSEPTPPPGLDQPQTGGRQADQRPALSTAGADATGGLILTLTTRRPRRWRRTSGAPLASG